MINPTDDNSTLATRMGSAAGSVPATNLQNNANPIQQTAAQAGDIATQQANSKQASNMINALGKNLSTGLSQTAQNDMSAFNTIFSINHPQASNVTISAPTPNLGVNPMETAPSSIMNTPMVTSDRNAKMNIRSAKSQTRMFLDQLNRIYK